MTPLHPARHLLRAKDLIDARYFEPLDVGATYVELRSRGVEFQQEPTKAPYGIDAALRDPSGNEIRLIQTT